MKGLRNWSTRVALENSIKRCEELLYAAISNPLKSNSDFFNLMLAEIIRCAGREEKN